MAPARYKSEPADASKLGEPLHFEFSNRTAPNRFMKAAMTERLSSWDPQNLEARGVPSKELINVYKRWGEGGFGVILTGNFMIDYDQLEAAGNAIVPRDAPFEGERFEAFKQMATEGKKHGALMVAQVSHPGRQATAQIQPNPISASDVQLQGNVLGMQFAKPRAATQDDISNVVEAFAHCAEYLEKAGYDGIQLHGAHGYLLAQFLSQSTNKREDEYGGSLENRARIILDMAAEIRRRTSPSFILGIKLNSVEFQAGGFQPEEARKLCELLEANRFDFVELSGGTYEALAFAHKRDSTRARESFFVEFAERITPGLTRTRSYVTGGLRTVAGMVKALEVVDGVGLARPATQEFALPRAILERGVTGAIEQKVDADDFGITNLIAGTQIRQVGKDQQPVDMSDEANVHAFLGDLAAWKDKVAADRDHRLYGYVDLTLQAAPYGAAA